MDKYKLKARVDKLFCHIDGAYAPNTLRAYRADFEEFMLYCNKRNKKPLPAPATVVAEFLINASDTGIKSATIRRKIASISAVHRLLDLSDPTKSAAVKLAARKIHRKLGTHFKQAYPVTNTVLQQLLAACEKDLRGLRNRALLWLAYDSMRRRSELVSLRIEDIEINENHLLSVRLRRSKTDQTGSGCWIHLGKEASKAVLKWLNAAKLKDGFIVRGIDPMGSVNEQLGVGQVGRIFKRLAKCAQLNDEAVRGISGHSMRVGSAQDLLIRGVSLPQLMVKGGWSKTDTVMRYVERVRQTAFIKAL